MKLRPILLGLSLVFFILAGAAAAYLVLGPSGNAPSGFDQERAFADLGYQVGLGPRTPGSSGHRQIISWILEKLSEAGWETNIQDTSYMDFPVKNVIATREVGPDRDWIILGAHYDTRFISEKDPDPENYLTPVPG
ncbi:MAG: hypothetical protein R3335_12630, partial [Anaerolineales bacterium]|nr:hypothetical protein [Anaerolineales bacterium]